MSCENCELHKGGFASESALLQFKKELVRLVDHNILEASGRVNIECGFMKKQYRCLSCGQNWLLEFPDQAFRGKWLKKV